MYRTHNCGELRLSEVGQSVTLCGWVQRTRKMGGMTFVDLRDRYGITQLVFNEETNAEPCAQANKLGREFVIQVIGTVNERYAKNDQNGHRRTRDHRRRTHCAQCQRSPPLHHRKKTLMAATICA